MLTVHQLSKAFSSQRILENLNFTINPGDRTGLIGPNGCGKTTLLRILAGLDTADSGSVTRTPPDLRLGYLAQGFDPQADARIGELIDEAMGGLKTLSAEVAGLAHALSLDPQDRRLQSTYSAALERLSTHQPVDPGRHAMILHSLGLDGISQDLPARNLSGGQKTRLALALAIVNDPHLLLLDEPTNHLDITMLEWLEVWLASFPGAALIVSHDRTFLDRTVNRILDLDPFTHTIREYKGNYTAYLEQIQTSHRKQEQAYRDQVAEIRRLRQDITRTKQHALRVEMATTSREPGVRRYAKKVARKAKAREKKLQRFLDSAERVEKPAQSWQLKLEFDSRTHLGQDVLTLEDLAVGYPDRPALLWGLNLQLRSGSRIALTGANGAGKTTLLRTITGQLPPLAGKVRLGASIRLGYMPQEQELLDPHLSGLETILQVAPLNETDARSFLHYFLFSGDDSLRPCGDLSYGERARLILATLIVKGCNLLLLDEPINHLDIPSRERFEAALSHFDGTVLAVVHDRYFIKRFANYLWVLENGVLRQEILTL